jgi:hypothetical protein
MEEVYKTLLPPSILINSELVQLCTKFDTIDKDRREYILMDLLHLKLSKYYLIPKA